MVKTKKLERLPDTIPLFPLPGALLLPSSKLPLNLFEPKYLQMLDDVLKTPERLIGMIQTTENKSKSEDKNLGLHKVGCAGRVINFTETDDSRYLITLTGISRFSLIKTIEGFTPYFKAKVDWSGFTVDQDKYVPEVAFDREKFFKVLSKYFEVAQLSSDWESLKNADEELLVNSLSVLCPFDPEEKQALLEAPTLKGRRETLITLMEMTLKAGPNYGPIQ